MGFGRRKVGIQDEGAWVFNRMVDAYRARPAYPDTLIDALVAEARLALPVLDVGAGLGHVTLPLGARGRDVIAIEPARRMCDALAERAASLPRVRVLHAAAEAIPVETQSVGLAIVADALHFLDAHRAGTELGRVLAPRGAFACVLCELADTPFMRDVTALMESSAPRRPRAVHATLRQVAGLIGVRLRDPVILDDHTPLDDDALLAVLGSISFIGPAMNEARTGAFQRRVRALPGARVWSRRFTLYVGQR